MSKKQWWTAIVAAMDVVTGCRSEGRAGHMRDVTKRSKAIVAVLALAAAGALTAAAPARAIQDSEERPSPRIKGSGWVGYDNPDQKVHFRAQLACSPPPDPDRAIFELSWGENSFSLDRMESAGCTNNLDDRGEPVSSSHQGSGVGTCNDEGGWIIDWKLTDGGQGRSGRDGRGDEVGVVVIGGSEGSEACNLSFDGPLGGGNIKMIVGPEY